MSDEFDLDVLAESFNEMLGAEWPKEKANAFTEAGQPYAAELWSQMAELGWLGLTVPEANGGLGLGIEAAARLHTALGTVSAAVPMLGTLLAVELVSAAGSDAQANDILPRIVDGSLRAAVAELDSAPLAIEGGKLSGTAAMVPDAGAADLIFLRATNGGTPCWVAIPADGAGVTVERHRLADTSRTLADVKLDGHVVNDDHIFTAQDAKALDDRLTRNACIAIASDSLGAGEAVLALTIEYMKGREQFGRVIGSFQALKHRVADHQNMLVAASYLLANAATLPADHPDALLEALSAKAHVTRVVAEVARDCIQLHGGVGFTVEYFPHLYLKRAKLNEALFGTRIVLLDRVADMLEAA